MRYIAIALGLAILLPAGAAVAAEKSQAQEVTLRDPTRPPAAYSAAFQPLPTAAVVQSFQPQQIMVVGADRFLLWNGRRYRVGDNLDGSRVERITESEVWLQGAEGRRKLSLFNGVEKQAPRSSTPAAEPKKSALGEDAATSKKGQKK